MLVLCEEISLLFGCLLENVPRQKDIQENILTKFSKKKKIKRKLSMVRRGIGKIVSFRLCLHSIVSLSLSALFLSSTCNKDDREQKNNKFFFNKTCRHHWGKLKHYFKFISLPCPWRSLKIS